MHQKNSKKQMETPFSTKMTMAIIGVAILVGLFLFMGEKTFPTDITYKRVGNDAHQYVPLREDPRRF